MQRSYLLTVSQLRIQASIELLLKKTLVAAKIWVSRYPVSLIIIHTSLPADAACGGAAEGGVMPLNQDMNITIYAAKGSNSSERVLWVLNYKEIAYTYVEVSAEDLVSGYLQINPYGYVPSIKIDDEIFSESVVIIELIEEIFPKKSLLPTSPYEKAKVREVCEYINSSVHTAQNRTVLNFLRPEIDQVSKKAIRAKWINTCLIKLEAKLFLQSQYAIGIQFSLADIFVAIIYRKGLSHGMEPLKSYKAHSSFLQSQATIRDTLPPKA